MGLLRREFLDQKSSSLRTGDEVVIVVLLLKKRRERISLCKCETSKINMTQLYTSTCLNNTSPNYLRISKHDGRKHLLVNTEEILVEFLCS